MKVSVLCNTYNHEKYIATAIDGFLNQKTEFDFEICIHDDSSTDNTPKIIEKYRLKYPKQIKVIYQTTNQYSLGKSVTLINLTQATGDLIALCEGDDFWIDNNKLQREYSEFQKNINLMLVLHSFKVVNIHFPFIYRKKVFSYNQKMIEMEDILKTFNPLFHLSTMMIKRECLVLDDFFVLEKALDVNLPILAKIKGEVCYLPQIMSVYRSGVSGSWTRRIALVRQNVIQRYAKKRKYYENLNHYLDYKYDRIINRQIHHIDLLIFIRTKEKNLGKLNELLRTYSSMSKIRYYLEYFFPNITFTIRELIVKYFI